jgi:hypothetical protein
LCLSVVWGSSEKFGVLLLDSSLEKFGGRGRGRLGVVWIICGCSCWVVWGWRGSFGCSLGGSGSSVDFSVAMHGLGVVLG